jgi:hypothetical protein
MGFYNDLCLYQDCDFSQVLVIPAVLAKFHPQAVECHVFNDLTIAPDMDVILRVESVDSAR